MRACVCVRACACVRASERASERMCVRACERACVRAGGRASVRACVRSCVLSCVRAGKCPSMRLFLCCATPPSAAQKVEAFGGGVPDAKSVCSCCTLLLTPSLEWASDARSSVFHASTLMSGTGADDETAVPDPASFADSPFAPFFVLFVPFVPFVPLVPFTLVLALPVAPLALSSSLSRESAVPASPRALSTPPCCTALLLPRPA
eukprot:6206061-Pleurochrysis_carterae.AAC.1